MTFQDVLAKYRAISFFCERDKGDRFEHLMQAFPRCPSRERRFLGHSMVFHQQQGKRGGKHPCGLGGSG